LLVAFLPSEALQFGWFIQARDAGILNTFAALNMPWLVSGLALVVFKMFFDGAYDKFNAARRAGRNQSEALLQSVLLPSILIALVVGAVLSFAAAHSLTWPLIVINSRELWALPVELAQMSGQFATQNVVMVGAAVYYIGLIGLFALPAFVILQIFALDRLSLLGGKSDDRIFGDIPKKLKQEESQLVVADEGSPIVYTR
jgi:multiple sugar transport system permease protein